MTFAGLTCPKRSLLQRLVRSLYLESEVDGVLCAHALQIPDAEQWRMRQMFIRECNREFAEAGILHINTQLHMRSVSAEPLSEAAALVEKKKIKRIGRYEDYFSYKIVSEFGKDAIISADDVRKATKCKHHLLTSILADLVRHNCLQKIGEAYRVTGEVDYNTLHSRLRRKLLRIICTHIIDTNPAASGWDHMLIPTAPAPDNASPAGSFLDPEATERLTGVSLYHQKDKKPNFARAIIAVPDKRNVVGRSETEEGREHGLSMQVYRALNGMIEDQEIFADVSIAALTTEDAQLLQDKSTERLKEFYATLPSTAACRSPKDSAHYIIAQIFAPITL